MAVDVSRAEGLAEKQEQFQGMTAEMFGSMLDQLRMYTEGIYPSLMDSFDIWVRVFVTLYLTLAGIGVATGYFKEATKQVITSMVLVVLLHTLIMESNSYFFWIVQPYVDLVFDVSTFFVANDGSFSVGFDNLFQNLDMMLAKLFLILDEIKAEGGLLSDAWFYVKAAIASLLLILLFGFLYAAFLAIIIMAYFSIYALFVVGGICIFFAAFKQTRFIFSAWLRGIFNYGLLAVFAAIIMSICMFGLNHGVDKFLTVASQSTIFGKDYWTAVFWCCVSIAMILKAPDLASVISGGSAGSTMGIAAGMGLLGSTVLGGASKILVGDNKNGLLPKAGRGLGSVGDESYRALKGVSR